MTTKHQKLAGGLQSLLDALELHNSKTASLLNVLQLHCSPTYLFLGTPKIPERVLASMMYTHKCGLKLFAPNEELRSAAQSSPFLGFVLRPSWLPLSRIITCPRDACQNRRLHLPWITKIFLPSASLQLLEEAKLEALLYCASKCEMSKWIDWSENDNKANTLANRLCVIAHHHQEIAQFDRNLQQLAATHYQRAVHKYCTTHLIPESIKTLMATRFAPQPNTSVIQALRIITNTLKNRQQRHWEDFQRVWREKLVILMFEKLSWDPKRQAAVLKDCLAVAQPVLEKTPDGRWETSLLIDRQTYGAFIRYFATRFLEEPSENKVDGEIVLLLWVTLYIARNTTKIYPIKRLLQLTTANIANRTLKIDKATIPLSLGLINLIKRYTSDQPLQRQQRLFPNLTQNNLRKPFHRASSALLPSGSTPALPEAFLYFPHPHKTLRITAEASQKQREDTRIFHDPISLDELSLQLATKSKRRP